MTLSKLLNQTKHWVKYQHFESLVRPGKNYFLFLVSRPTHVQPPESKYFIAI